MRTWKTLLIVGVVAALAGLALAHEEDSQSRGRVQILHLDEDGERHERSWVLDESQGFLGVNLGRDEDGRGALVAGVLEDTAAEDAGLREGDIITGLDGEEIRDSRALTRALRGLEPGDEVELEILRDGRDEALRVELGEHPRMFSFAFGDQEDGPFEFSFGMTDLDDRLAELHERLQDMDFGGNFVMDLDDFDGPGLMRFGHGRPQLGVQVIQPTPELRRHMGSSEDLGILVGKVLPGTTAEKAGVAVGDLIVAVDNDQIADARDLTRALERRAGKDITLEVVRDGRTVKLEATLAQEEHEAPHFRAPAQPMRQPLHPTTPSQKA